MPAQPRLLFVNLPVKDLQVSKDFFAALGFALNPKFTNDECACMVISDQAYAMLLQESRFAEFSPTPIADAHTTTEALLCVSAESRDDVDAFADTALAHGGATAREAQDHGFMYGRSFLDPDGHVWEVMWMDPAAVDAGPAEFEHQAA